MISNKLKIIGQYPYYQYVQSYLKEYYLIIYITTLYPTILLLQINLDSNQVTQQPISYYILPTLFTLQLI